MTDKRGARVCVVPEPGESEVEIAHRAVQAMVRATASMVSAFEEITPTALDVGKHGRQVRVWHGVAAGKKDK